MSEAAPFCPILAVIMNDVRDQCKSKDKETLIAVEDLLRQYIYNDMPFAQVHPEFVKLVGTDLPLLKLNTILNMDNKPLPPAPELFISNGLFSKQNQFVARKKARAWTEAEDLRLLAGIHKYGLDAWGAVTSFVGSGRSRSQCSQRWFRGLDPRISKVLWTADEDERLLALVAEHGDHSWTRIANELGNRSDAQCRYRYSHITKSEQQQHSEQIAPHPTGIKETISMPVSLMMNVKMLSETRSMSTLPKIQLPPIGDLLSCIDTRKPAHVDVLDRLFV